ncbi:uncharacterized protein LOC109839081 [Asparagus officinalis]|uniref:uncharacterized protein LOC109839081 n=1 Tax=Asparagus officinalis TaxID=4686 RepID=UPI00098E5E28|nr:uncharacterized protein LOC109839081 [Asparagus officinalis]
MVKLIAHHKWNIYHLAIKSALLIGVLKKEVYMQQPEGFLVKWQEDKVYHLTKALYGLKQAPIDGYLHQNSFIKCPYEHAIYMKRNHKGSNTKMLAEFKAAMSNEFEMTDNRLMSYFLGIEVKQQQEGIFISQKNYMKEILEKFKMNECNHVNTLVAIRMKFSRERDGHFVDSTLFKSLAGSLRYLTITRPDITYGVGLVSRYMETSKESNLLASKRILRYIKGTLNLGLFYAYDENAQLVCYSDSDEGGDQDERKNTIGYVFYLGSTAISWTSKKQGVVTLSSCETEYVAAASTVLDHPQEDSIVIFMDNKSAIQLAKNPLHHGRSKHIDTRFYFLKDHIKQKTIELKHCHTTEQVTDIFTKPLSGETFMRLRDMLGIKIF